MADPGGTAADTVGSDRAEAIGDFAEALRDLRTVAGTPSFRDMAARSRAISHTTLHDAAGGTRLPSWATTVEFVKACGGDPADYRERWEGANRIVRAQPAPVPPAISEEPESEQPAAEKPAPVVPTVLAPARRRLRSRVGVYASVVALLVVATVVAVAVAAGNDGPSGAAPATAQTAADCPVRQQNPPWEPPATKGDAMTFVDDITLPDCTHVQSGARVTKLWRFKNTGTVPWHGYTLRRLDLPQQPDECQTINDVPVHATEPGHFVDVGVEVTAPPSSGFCFVRFKLMDGNGRVAFPGNRPVNFQLIVD